jgi:hypothetical protein
VREKYEFEREQALWAELRFALENSGRAPAEDIDVVMDWPGDLAIYAADRTPEGPQVPPPPRRPAFGIQMPTVSAPVFPTPLTGMPLADPTPEESMEVTRGENARLLIHIRGVKHNYHFRTSPVTLAFASVEEARSFGVPFIVYAGNVPDPVKGTLHVKASVVT